MVVLLTLSSFASCSKLARVVAVAFEPLELYNWTYFASQTCSPAAVKATVLLLKDRNTL